MFSLQVAKKKDHKSGKKHKDLISLHLIRRIVNVDGADGKQIASFSFMNRFLHMFVLGTSNLFCLTIRDNLCDNNISFAFNGVNNRRDSIGSNGSFDLKNCKKEFLDQLCNLVVKQTGRTEFNVESYFAGSNDDNELATTIRQAVK